MGDTSTFAKRLREARTRAGLSQKQLGITAGIDAFSSSPRINQYERGKHAPDYATAQRLARVLKVPTPYLYCDDDMVAEVILLLGKLSTVKKRKLLGELQKLIKIKQ
jgi:transcriptional regulator with XRE-family HTH domain